MVRKDNGINSTVMNELMSLSFNHFEKDEI